MSKIVQNKRPRRYRCFAGTCRGVAAWPVVAAVFVSQTMSAGYWVSWPLLASDEFAERRLLEITPLGTSLVDVERTLVARNWRPSLGRGRRGMLLSQTISPRWLRRYLPVHVHAIWIFDDDNNLDEIRIERSLDGP